MPQMSPLMWEMLNMSSLFMILLMLLKVFFLNTEFAANNKPMQPSKNNMMNTFNWPW